jgi:hypothetical protein
MTSPYVITGRIAGLNDIAVLVSSCDKYHDLWEPFFTLFFRYWPDSPYKVYLLSNHRRYHDARVETIAVGDDRDWSSGFGSALRQIPNSYVIVMMEDYLLAKPVDTDKIIALAAYMEQRKAGCLRLFPCPGPNVPCADNPEVGEILKGSDYRLSLQAAIWDKDVLLSLLKEGESPWQLELHGTKRTNALDVPFLCVKENSSNTYPIPYFCTAVLRGKWLPGAVRLCKKEGIKIDLSVRPQQGFYDRFRRSRTFKAMTKVRSIIPYKRRG